jgi:predicted RND superfamily exporter protein
MLMGVIVNNAIVMLEKIKQLHEDGMPHYDAVKTACVERLRPILMTTLTTILALVPMAIGVGQGSELMQPLGIVVIGGLLIGTLVTLALVPALYCLVYRLSEKFPEGKKRGKGKKSEKDGDTLADENCVKPDTVDDISDEKAFESDKTQGALKLNNLPQGNI